MSSGQRTYIKAGRGGTVRGGLSSSHKLLLALAAALFLPSLLKRAYDQPAQLDLSSFRVVSHYDLPAIQQRDSVLRVEFCSS
mmetsp:Transcript_28224/g.49453  ORF Transcript_28224/g.49453 Transcript_28224/m.49453 type:complete len:82 (+) Transcript_28224:18-263(+)